MKIDLNKELSEFNRFLKRNRVGSVDLEELVSLKSAVQRGDKSQVRRCLKEHPILQSYIDYLEAPKLEAGSGAVSDNDFITLQDRIGLPSSLLQPVIAYLEYLSLIIGSSMLPASSFLDVGCGEALISTFLRKRGFVSGRCAATDLSSSSIQGAKVLAETEKVSVEFSVAPATNLPFIAGSFNQIICIDCLHFVLEWKKALGELRRLLPVGGRLFLVYNQDPSYRSNINFREMESELERLGLKYRRCTSSIFSDVGVILDCSVIS